MKVVKERRQVTFTLTYRDSAGDSYTPTKVIYELIDVKSLNSIISKTEVVPASNVVTVTVSATQNSVVDSTKPYETKLFSFEWYDGSTLLGSEDCYYRVKNSMRIPIA
jgi:translation elongation factor EF-1alpha